MSRTLRVCPCLVRKQLQEMSQTSVRLQIVQRRLRSQARTSCDSPAERWETSSGRERRLEFHSPRRPVCGLHSSRIEWRQLSNVQKGQDDCSQGYARCIDRNSCNSRCASHRGQESDNGIGCFRMEFHSRETHRGWLRSFFSARTETLEKLEVHVTTLDSGKSPHPSRRHPNEEMLNCARRDRRIEQQWCDSYLTVIAPANPRRQPGCAR
jgi:hypothetical protein